MQQTLPVYQYIPLVAPLGIGWMETTLSALYTLLTVCAIAVIIHDKKEPVKTLAWIAVIALVPLIGIICYLAVGRNHRKEKMFGSKTLLNYSHIDLLCRRQLRDLCNPDLRHNDDVSNNIEIIKLLLNNNKALLAMHNEVEILDNGDNTFDSLFEALRGARSSIHLEYYVFENDSIGRIVASILAEKAAEGVEVRLIYDDVGSWHPKRRFVKRMRDAGIEVECFLPVAFPWVTKHLNYRNHRKIVVVDGKIAFTGGINIAERYVKGTRFGPWRDIHLRIEGEAVRLLQAVFISDWYFVRGRLLTEDKYFPPTQVKTVSPMQIASSGPDSDWATIMQAFFSAISKAKDHIYISTPYFIPNAALLTAMKVAALSGVKVKLIIPLRSDSRLVYWATRSYVPELLDAGVEVYMYNAGFNHSKLLVIDGEFSSVGSANMDIRSFEDNFEVSAVMYDGKIAKRLTESFEDDLQHSIRITPQMWNGRSQLHATYESLARLLSPLL